MSESGNNGNNNMNLIENLLRVSPDNGNGSTELLILVAISIAISVLVRLHRALGR
jgi:hypothetical protein